MYYVLWYGAYVANADKGTQFISVTTLKFIIKLYIYCIIVPGDSVYIVYRYSVIKNSLESEKWSI